VVGSSIRRSKAYGTSEVREKVAQVVVESLGADLEKWCHVHLGLTRIVGHQGIELRVFERGNDALLRGRCVDLRAEGSGDADADAFLPDTVGTHNDEQTPPSLFLMDRGENLLALMWVLLNLNIVNILAICWLGFDFGLRFFPHELRHPFACSLTFHLLPAIVLIWCVLAQAHAHIRTCLYHRLLIRKGIFGVEVCGIQITDIDLLLLRLASQLVLDIRHK